MKHAATSVQLMGARRFWPLFWVQFLGALNDQIYKNAFIALLTFRIAVEQDYTAAQLSIYISLAAAVYILPFFLIAPTAGIVSDRMDKAVMMRWVKLIEILLMCGAVLAYTLVSVWLLFLILVLMGTQSAIFSPIKYGILPQHLMTQDLATGNGLVQAGTFLAILLGTIIGTQIILTTYGTLATCILVVSLACIGYGASYFVPPAPPVQDFTSTLRVRWNILATVWRLVSEIRRIPRVFTIILLTAWFWFIGAAYLTVLPVYVKEVLGASEDVMTVLLAAFSIGVALGAVLCARLSKGQITFRHVPVSAFGIAVFGVYLSFVDIHPLAGVSDFLSDPTGWQILVSFVGLALCGGMYITPLNTAMQHYAPQDKRGQVIACSNVLDSAAMVITSLLIIALQFLEVSVPSLFGVFALTGLPIAIYVSLKNTEKKIIN